MLMAKWHAKHEIDKNKNRKKKMVRGEDEKHIGELLSLANCIQSILKIFQFFFFFYFFSSVKHFASMTNDIYLCITNTIAIKKESKKFTCTHKKKQKILDMLILNKRPTLDP